MTDMLTLWSSLKTEAHELLISARFGAPILAEPSTVQALIDLGLLRRDLTLTGAGVSLVANRW